MLLETEKERVCINKIIGQNEKETIVEGDVIVNDVKPDVLNIISTDGIPCIYKKEVMDGKVRIDGCINTYIIYLADDENSTVRSLNTVLDFTQMIDIEECMPEMTLQESVNIKNIECKILNGRKINVKISLVIGSKVYSNDNIEVIYNIKNLEDIQVLNSNKKVNSLVGEGETRVFAKDTVTVNSSDEIAEIMKANIKIINKDIKLSYNKILAKADLDASILYLTEDNRIRNINTTIPVMGFIDINGISDNSICDVNYQVKNLIIKPNTSDINSIYVEAEIEISCCAYEVKSINIIDDLYSISSNLSFIPKEVCTMAGKYRLKEICDINEQINVPEMDGNKLCSAKVMPNILNTTIKNGKIIYEGEIGIEFLFETSNSLNSKDIILPFKFELISDEVVEGCNVNTCADVKRDEFVVNNSNIDVKIQLEFNVSINRLEKLNIIDEISVEDSKQNDIYSMVIYFVKPGDTLWKIAKNFKSTVDDIAGVNNIEDVNRINPGEQLYIPKFINKKKAV